MPALSPAPRHRRRGRLLHLTAVALLPLALAACSEGPADTSTGGTPDPAARAAVERNVQTCMREAGFEYVTTTPEEPEPDDAAQAQSLDAARSLGYGISTALSGPPEGLTTAGQDPNAAVRAGLPAPEQAAYDRALVGDGGGAQGCLLTAAEEAGLPVLDPAAEAEQAADLELRVDSDADVVSARRAWSACMREAGYAYSRPSDAVEDFLQRVGAVTAGSPELLALQEEERATATQDVRCYEQHLADVEPRVRAELERTSGTGGR